jgi:hypothetical protein
MKGKEEAGLGRTGHGRGSGGGRTTEAATVVAESMVPTTVESSSAPVMMESRPFPTVAESRVDLTGVGQNGKALL